MSLRDSLQNQLAEAARETGFEPALELMLEQARECAWMVPSPQKAKAGAGLVSKIGGTPDLPRDAEWPAGRNEAGEKEGNASFITQINLVDVPAIDGLPLPRQGGLWLFLPAWHRGPEVQAIFRSEVVTLRTRTQAREPGSVVFWTDVANPEATAIAFLPGVSLPLYRRSFLAELREVLGKGETFSAWGRFMAHLQPRTHYGRLGGYCQDYDTTDIYRYAAFQRLGHMEHRGAWQWDSLAAYERELDKWAQRANEAAGQRKGLFARWSPQAQVAAIPGKMLASYQKLRSSVEWMDAHQQELVAEAESLQVLGTWTSGLLRLGGGEALDVLIRSEDLSAGRFDGLTAECPMVS